MTTAQSEHREDEVLPGLLYAGLTVLTGARLTGKSWLALDVASAVSMKKSALGYIKPAKYGQTLFICHDKYDCNMAVGRLLKLRNISAAGVSGMPREWPDFRTWAEVNDTTDDFVEKLRHFSGGHQSLRLIVIDSLSSTQDDGKPSPQGKLPYDKAVAALQQLEQFALQREWPLPILVVADEDYGAKRVWRLIRAWGERTARLEVNGRDILDQTLALNFIDGRFSPVTAEAAP